MTDTEFLEAQIRSLKAENDRLRRTLRDEFAGRALQGILSNPDPDLIVTNEKTARWAYQFADAMLAARNQ